MADGRRALGPDRRRFYGRSCQKRGGARLDRSEGMAETRVPRSLSFIVGLKLDVADVVADPNGAKFASPMSTSDFDFALPPADLKY